MSSPTTDAKVRQAKYTPGPWKLSRWHPRITLLGTNGIAICELNSGNNEANAHLIAAAPDHHTANRIAREAIEELKSWACRCSETNGGGDCAQCLMADQAIAELDAAYAKATGQEINNG